MSIINKALKKAQQEQQRVQGGTPWVLPASTAEAPRKRSQTVWIVGAALFALSLGATLHAWLASPTAQVETVFEPTRSVTDPIPQLELEKLSKETGMGSNPAHQTVNAAPERQPDRPRPASVAPVRPIPIALARRPSPPLTAAGYTARGNALYRQGKYPRAVDMYQAALALDPLDVKARNNLGSAYLQLTLDDRALAAFQEVLRLDDSYSLAYYNLACVHARAGNVERAVAYLLQAVAIEPEARNWASTDADFASVRNAPEFRQILEP